MHPSLVLSEEVLAVEIVMGRLHGDVVAGSTPGPFPFFGRVAEPYVATEESQFKMLRGDVAFPFVLGAESAGAAIVREAADKESSRVF